MKDLLQAKDAALRWLKPTTRGIMKSFRSGIAVELKADRSPVTLADRTAEEYLRKRITREFPDHGIIGEEFGEEHAEREWVWTVDPIDGTRSFIQGLPLFATLISLLRHGEPVMGIICLPALQETAWAVKGQGAFCGNSRLQVSSHETLQGATLGIADVYCFRKTKRLGLVQNLHQRAELVRTYPDAFGHLMAVRGAVDAMIDPLAYIWDYAPCKILVEEAGGAFANFSGKKGSIHEGTALVGNPKLVKRLQQLIARGK